MAVDGVDKKVIFRLYILFFTFCGLSINNIFLFKYMNNSKMKKILTFRPHVICTEGCVVPRVNNRP